MNKREIILTKALQLFVTNGIHATPMSAIAMTANTGMGTIYNYFPTKEALINAIYLHVKAAEIAVHFKNWQDNDSIKEKFLEFYISFIDYYLKHPLHFAFMDQMQQSPIITDETKMQGKREFEPIFELIIKGQQAGKIKPIAIDNILQFLSGTINSFVRSSLGLKNNTLNKKINDQLIMVWDAIST